MLAFSCLMMIFIVYACSRAVWNLIRRKTKAKTFKAILWATYIILGYIVGCLIILRNGSCITDTDCIADLLALFSFYPICGVFVTHYATKELKCILMGRPEISEMVIYPEILTRSSETNSRNDTLIIVQKKNPQALKKLLARISSTYFNTIPQGSTLVKGRHFLHKSPTLPQIGITLMANQDSTKAKPKLKKAASFDLDTKAHPTAKELGSLTDRRYCLICLESFSNSVLMPCGHGGLCSVCALKILHCNRSCHLCRQTVNEVTEYENTEDFRVKRIIKTFGTVETK
eukprot:TRINITY_DN3397_c0_g1_i3.p1 TRINITY_DN3397_c0_g1~~TRINITY_DN3397_c0_g1_i3.p1  ORF type:complete len:287 (+),score=18.80 TRINITY_DN3397_c0_g1_i3:324-1184(+)